MYSNTKQAYLDQSFVNEIYSKKTFESLCSVFVMVNFGLSWKKMKRLYSVSIFTISDTGNARDS